LAKPKCTAEIYKIMEWLKDLSDKLILWFLRTTAGFGKELTTDGRREQQLWREQRMRNLQGLAQRSKQRFGDKNK
jgi:ABC-type siderophore export system fused ATPase/permease subunit